MRVSLTGWFAGLSSFCLSIIIGDDWISALGVGLVTMSAFDFITKIGRSFPLLELIFMISALQLILGPYFAYRLPVSYFRYKMYTPEPEYMFVAVIAHVLFLLGLVFLKNSFDIRSVKLQITQLTNRYPFIGVHFILFGLFATLVQTYTPVSIRFVLYLASNLIYVGAILYYFSEERPYRTAIFGASLAFAFLQATQTGLFHDFLLWVTLGGTLIAINLKTTLPFRIMVIMVAVFLIMVLQSVKLEYRTRVGTTSFSSLDRISLLAALATTEIQNPDKLFSPEKLSELNVRLNQGWITSAIMIHVPAQVPFENGETIWVSFQNALLPRFLVPEKLNAGGRENFRLYTGIPIDNNTSMGIGLLGEAYVNFGTLGGIFLLFWGVFLGGVLRIIYHASKTNILIFLFTPLIFLQVIKAETDMITVLNHLVKSLLFVVVLYPIWLSSYKITQASSI